ncbi:MAG: hypothetical protein P8J33_16930 [Pirellulaceae bacterium]|nr:hypothetical protein [Pirellulaceae bacterium]
MNPKLLLVVVVTIASSGFTHAQTWTTPDGILSVTRPDSEIFTVVPSPPEPFVGLWISNDEATKLGVMTTQIPTNIKLNQSSVEEGLAEEIGGEVIRLPTKQIAGYEVWRMQATGASIEITQAIIRHDSTLFKLMAVTVGQNPDEQSINNFMDSISIFQSAKKAAPGTSTKPRKPNNSNDDGIDSHNLSKSIGGFAGLLGIGILIYIAVRGKNRRQS